MYAFGAPTTRLWEPVFGPPATQVLDPEQSAFVLQGVRVPWPVQSPCSLYPTMRFPLPFTAPLVAPDPETICRLIPLS